jgi:anaphase-promoting complex subunit 10
MGARLLLMDVGHREITRSALWTVSSVKGGYEISSMFDGKTDTFWQSDSLPPHWITAQFPKQTLLSKLSLYLSIQQDETYTPVELIVYIGNDPTSLTEFRKEEPTQYQGWIDIELNVPTIFLKVSITKNHQGGRDSRIRQIRLFGAPYSPCIDTSVCFIAPELTQYLSIR